MICDRGEKTAFCLREAKDRNGLLMRGKLFEDGWMDDQTDSHAVSEG